MNKKSLTRSVPYWVLLVVSLASAAVGAWLASDQISTMTTTLLDGTATNVEVYVGPSKVVVGAALLGAGVVGVLFALVLAAAKALLPAAPPVVVEPIDWTAESDEGETEPANELTDSNAVDAPSADSASDDSEVETDEEGQNGSSGSIAIATNSNVK